MHQFHMNFNCIFYEKNIDKWIDKWNDSTNFQLKSDYLLFFQSILLMPPRNKQNIKTVSAKIILNILSNNPETAVRQLPVTLYILRASTDPLLTLEILKGVPVLASLKVNIIYIFFLS